jgi:hypothetical protein
MNVPKHHLPVMNRVLRQPIISLKPMIVEDAIFLIHLKPAEGMADFINNLLNSPKTLSFER